MAAGPMKTQPLKVTAKPARRLPGVFAAFITVLISFNLSPKAWSDGDLFWTGMEASPDAAGSGSWVTPEPSGVFSWSSTSPTETAALWVDGSDAHFLGSAGGTVTLGSAIVAASINFDPGANLFTIITNGATLTLNIAGIVNTSGNTQTISITEGGTTFNNDASAGTATINNNGALQFNDTSTAATATITNGFDGTTSFHDNSTAETATIVNNEGGTTSFNDNSTAATATIVNNEGTTSFFGTSTAASATITNNLGGVTNFNDTSTAGTATIVNNPGSGVFFNDASSGGSATITNNGSAGDIVSGTPFGAVTEFFTTSTAGSATITNNGGTAAGTIGGITQFLDTSSAGIATIITNGGTGGGLGGATEFLDSPDGGTARAVTNGNGSFDISGLTTDGMGIGSIEGSGNYFLGSKTLSVGGNNLSTTVSGIIQDGGANGGVGGSLTKVGTGTLTLTGLNTYSGGTNFNGGIVAVNSDLNLGTGPLSFNGGTLEALTSGVGITSSKAVMLNIGGGTFLADTGTLSRLGGAISGDGSLTKAGPGTLVLAGVSTYTGSTTISAGTLQAGSATGLSPNSEFTVNSILDLHGFTNTIGSLSGTGTILNNGAAAAALAVGVDNASTSFDGVLEDGTSALTLSKSGTGTLTLTGTNTYTGGTIINAGTLQIGNSGTNGSITGNIIDNGTLAVDRSGSLTLAGVIVGTGNLINLGPGRLTLTGTNLYTGGTTISNGTLQIGNGGSTGSVIGNVADNSILIFDRSDSYTFGGVISGRGILIQQGSGTLTLPNTNTYTGVTIVNAGSLIVDGSIASTKTVVNAAGLLGGHGSLGGNLVNNGIVSPGNSPGTLTVLGNYTQNAAGNLLIEIAGLAASEHALLAVSGHASLSGTLQLIGLGNFKLHVGDQLTFLIANGGVSGSFGTVQNEISTGTVVQAQVVTLSNAVLVEGTQGSFVQAACNPNSVAVAQALDGAVGNPRASTLSPSLTTNRSTNSAATSP
jgi:autotransporter-associated beta strand protein